MNIRLFLAGQQLELTQDITFPMNKTYESLTDPTQIIVDYSKSINIPMTVHNNKVFANAYRLDRSILGGGDSNIGFHLDPTKKIPFRLDYNGDILLEGYAKYVSASYSTNKKCYTINLFGILGEVFQELLSVVPSQSKLGDLDRKYLLNDTLYTTSGIPKLTKETVYASWENDNPDCWIPGKTDKVSWTDMYGFAPAHQGIYKGFKGDKMQIGEGEIVELADYLNRHWNRASDPQDQKEDVDFGAGDIVGDGFPDYVMNEYRASKMKPYIYLNQLMRMYVDKCSELTDYKITLDKDWFNENNPYWSKMLYTLDYLNLENQIDSTRFQLFPPSGYQSLVNRCTISGNTVTASLLPKSDNSRSFMSSEGFYINPFQIQFGVSQSIYQYTGDLKDVDLLLQDETAVKFKIDIYRKEGNSRVGEPQTFYYWTSGHNYSGVVNNEESIYTDNNFIYNWIDKKDINKYGDSEINYAVEIPELFVPGVYTDGCQMEITVSYYNKRGTGDSPALYVLYYSDYLGDHEVPIYPGWDNGDIADWRYHWNWDTIYSQTAAGETEDITISTLYKNDNPLFNIILQYTKMFGLYWDVDYGNKEIKIITRRNLFKDYTVTNWDDKLDRKKDLAIEPLTFKEKYILFNYDDVDGYIYTDYKDTFGVNVGEKRLSTGYAFNTEDKKLFSGIKPSSMSSRSYITFNKIYVWDRQSILQPTVEQFTLIDTDDKDQKAPISLNSWFMRGENYSKNCYLTSDTQLMEEKNTYCWLDDTYCISSGAGLQSNILPNISTAIKMGNITYSCNFNTPIEDRTFNKILSNTLNTNIYELCWKDYLNERYNIQNKKVTGYFYLTNEDYNNFKFNQFVTLDNQLFMINKIYDFDINNPKSTKIDLVQINDPTKLTNKIFGNQATTFKLRR